MKRHINGRNIAVILGILWLIDGLAQLQPKMFTNQFPNKVILQSSINQPHLLASLIHFFINLFLINPALFNSLIIITQLGLGLLILYKRTSILGLKLSIPWSLFVWIIGEGLGGIFNHSGNLLIGLPGAALLYGLLAIIALRQITKSKDQNYAGYSVNFIWAAVWVLGGILQLLPMQNSANSLMSNTMPMISQPGWMYSLNLHISTSLSRLAGQHSMNMSMTPISSSGYWFILTLAIIEILIGISVFMPGKIRLVLIWLGICFSVAFWLIGQNLGGFYSGLATDPNTGPLLIIVGLAALSLKDNETFMRRVLKKVELVIT